MASIQRFGFSQQQNDLSKIFKALGHPARVAIIQCLINDGRIMSKAIACDMPITQPAISKHLQILFETGLIGYEKVSNVTYYTVNPLLIEMAEGALKELRTEVKMKNEDFSRVIVNTQIIPEAF
ncbi:MAG: metalloregulator ArsR/SmtB family transcription factor [Crocinitomicaceae bacterium]